MCTVWIPIKDKVLYDITYFYCLTGNATSAYPYMSPWGSLKLLDMKHQSLHLKIMVQWLRVNFLNS